MIGRRLSCGDDGGHVPNPRSKYLRLTEHRKRRLGAREFGVNDDGETVRIDVENEQGSGSVQIGGDQELPADFPVPLPDGGQVVQSVESQMGDESFFQVVVRYEDRTHEELVDFFTDYFAQYEDTVMSTSTGATSLAIFQSGDAELTVQVITDGTGTQVSISNVR